MNRNRFNSPFIGFGPNNSPNSNWQPRNNGPKQSLSPDFIPFQYSSPLSSFKNNDNCNRRNYHRGSMRMHDRNFSSPQSGGSNFSSPYNSYRFNPSGDFRKNNFRQRQRNNFKANGSTYNSHLYFNNSMIQDPWEELEKELTEEKSFETSQNSTNDLGRTFGNVRENNSNYGSTKIEEDVSSCSPDENNSSFNVSTTNSTNSDKSV